MRVEIALLIAVATSWCRPPAQNADLCSLLTQIEEVPVEGRGTDPSFQRLFDKRDDAVDCLVDHIDDATSIADPRQSPTRQSEFTVGDLAFLLLVQFGQIDRTRVLPPEVNEEYETVGVLAYFSWIRSDGNRVELEEAVRSSIRERGAVGQGERF